MPKPPVNPARPLNTQPARAALATPSELREVAAEYLKAGLPASAQHLEALAVKYERMAPAERGRVNEGLR